MRAEEPRALLRATHSSCRSARYATGSQRGTCARFTASSNRASRRQKQRQQNKPMKSLMAVPPIWGGCEEAVAFACSAAKRLGAALDIVFLDDRSDYPVLASVGEAMYGMSHEQRDEEERRELVENAKRLHQDMLASGNIAGRFVEEPQVADRVMTSMARLQDAILLVRPTHDVGKTYQEAARIAIFESSRPVLVAPNSVTDLRLGHAFVVWSETAQAASAIQAFTQLADKFER